MIHQSISYLMVSHFSFVILICFDQNVTVLDPTHKLSYLNIAWEPEFIETGMMHLRKIVGYFILLQVVGILT